ncbi:MFS transporter [Dongia soli]|nr:MFS transporter [Dongia soli]
MSTGAAEASRTCMGNADDKAESVILQILTTVVFTFICYLTVGIPLAVLPSYVHVDLGYGSVLAGIVISTQYLATLLTRPHAGQTCDLIGPKQAVVYGLIACGISGIFLLIAAMFAGTPWISLLFLLIGRLVLGFGESLVGTGSITWGIGQIGATHTARMISWNGIATYGALALGAPLGVILTGNLGFASIGASIALLAVIGLGLSYLKRPTQVVTGDRLAFRRVFGRVLPHGLGLALGSTGFGTIATFITLFYASRNWPNAAFTLTLFGAAFIGTRLLFANAINRFGGFRVAMVSFVVEVVGLVLLSGAGVPHLALAGAALTGCGFALVFPALGVEAVGLVPPSNRGAALGAYSVFADLSLGITGPLIGFIISLYGYPSAFLCAAIAAAIALILTVLLYRRSFRMAPAVTH